ncbi:MAG: 1-acyl-sn-glycerol-3-phosphate acyltransferase [Lachnospiraceae bacterium]|nr:1-acyl-sn-glycerol-3-phosphate acyltransferase [Lachnospiraceae bacterium]
MAYRGTMEKTKTVDERKQERYYKFYHALKVIAGPVCRFLFGIRKEDEIKLSEEPCLIVANHTCYFDPLIIAMCVDQPLYFVAGENLQRQKVAAFAAMKIFHCISCSKGKISVQTIREITRNLKAGHNVHMFAEGNITYDGTTAPLNLVNGKLFRSLQCTVVTVNITGGYQIVPRWSGKFCRGTIHAQLKGIYTKEQLHDMTPAQILEQVNRDIYAEQPAAEETDDRRYRRGAKGIHYVLYACPECGALGQIIGKGKSILCHSCGKTWQYNEHGKIEGGFFQTIYQWNRWQQAHIRELVAEKLPIEISTPKARLISVMDNHSRQVRALGTLLMNREKLVCGETEFALNDISRMDTRNKGIILFSLQNGDYYEINTKKGFSGLMYKTVFEALRESGS